MIELSTSRNPKAGVGRINTTRSTNQAVGNRNNDVYVGSISPHMNSHHTSISDHEVQGILQDVDRNVYVGGASSNGLPTCLSSSTRWFQLVMFAMFLIALCFAMFSKYENLSPGLIWGAILSCFSVIFVIVSYVSVPNYRQHPNPLMFWRTIADAIFVCQLLTQQFVRCVFYECQPLCNTKNLQCGCSMASTAGETCTIFAGLFEFSLLAAECWFFCMTLNLLVSLTNPFTDFKRNTKLFHLFCWGFPLVLGILLLTVPNFAGYSDLGVCWTNALRKLPADPKFSCGPNDDVLDNFADNYKPVNANILSWVFFYVWMGIFILFGIVVWIWVWKRLSEGMPETYAVRVQSIQRARFNVMAVTSYWIVVGIIYIQFLSRNRFDVDPLISELLNFVIAAKGYLDLVIWFALNDFQWKHFTIHCWNSKELQDVDIDLNPQVNAALRKEVLFYTTSGIIQAVLAAERLPASQRIQHLALLPQTKSTNTTITNTTTTPTTTTNTTTRSTGPTLPVPSSSSSSTMANDYYYAPQDTQYPQSPPVFDTTMRTALPPLPCRPPPLSSSSSPKSSSSSSQRTKTFHDYEPHAFKKIRERFGVNNEAYIESLSTTAKERLSEGASGAFMFFSSDGALIVKSTSKEECFFLRSIANQYADYLCANEKTLLTRFYGCHCLELYGKSFFFVVMANFFDTKQIIHSRYDIKGSWVNRHGELPKRSKKVTCRHCNRKYFYQGLNPEDTICPVRLGGHEPNVVLKDSDLTQKLKLNKEEAVHLYQQLCMDSDLLCSFGIMDYSLLMGINEVEYVVEENITNGNGIVLDHDFEMNQIRLGKRGTIGTNTNNRASVSLHHHNYNTTATSTTTNTTSTTTESNPNYYNPFGEKAVMIDGTKANGGSTSTIGGNRSNNMPSRPHPHRFSVTSRPSFAEKNQQLSPSLPINNTKRRPSRQGFGAQRGDRAVSNVSSSGRRLPRSGMRLANTVVGPAYYHLGIIDILQTWTFKKKMERFLKIVLKRVDGEGLSAIEPTMYKRRFQLKMADILGIEDLDVITAGDMDLFTQQNLHMDVETERTSNVGIQSIRSLPADHYHHPSSSDQHFESNMLRHRSMAPAPRKSQENISSQEAMEDYTGIDYHL